MHHNVILTASTTTNNKLRVSLNSLTSTNLQNKNCSTSITGSQNKYAMTVNDKCHTVALYLTLTFKYRVG